MNYVGNSHAIINGWPNAEMDEKTCRRLWKLVAPHANRYNEWGHGAALAALYWQSWAYVTYCYDKYVIMYRIHECVCVCVCMWWTTCTWEVPGRCLVGHCDDVARKYCARMEAHKVLLSPNAFAFTHIQTYT